MQTETISLVVPCHNEGPALKLFYAAIDQLKPALADYELELLFIDDGSTDETLTVMKELAHQPEVNYLSFSRNFGKEAAMYAGLKHARGDYVAVLDADLQDPPELLLRMLPILKNGTYDCVGARRTNRENEPRIRSYFSRMFYRLINNISDTEIPDGVRDFRLMKRNMVDSILAVTEYNRFSKGIFSWVGYNTYYLEYENQERVAGKTSWSFRQLLSYSLEGIISFSVFPLAIASFIGILTFVLALIFMFIIVLRALIWGDPVSGWPSTISIILFLGGIQLFCLGIIGQYIGKIFLEVKQRPLYLIKESQLKASENTLEK